MRTIQIRLSYGFAALVVLASVGRPSAIQGAEGLIGVETADQPVVWFDGMVGWAFDVVVPIQVTHLGLFNINSTTGGALQQVHRIGIWDASLSLLTSGTVGPGVSDATSGVWEYASIAPTPLALGRYVIGAQYMSGSPDSLVQPLASTDPAIAYVEWRVGFGTEFYIPWSNLPLPDQPFGNVVGPNFQFTPVPEPGALSLLSLATIGALVALLCRRSKS